MTSLPLLVGEVFMRAGDPGVELEGVCAVIATGNKQSANLPEFVDNESLIFLCPASPVFIGSAEYGVVKKTQFCEYFVINSR